MPIIIFAVAVLLARVRVGGAEPLMLTLAWGVLVPLALWWMSRHLLLGAITTLWVLALMFPAHVIAAGAPPPCLGWGLGLFFLGWLIQFIGTTTKGASAFVDDVTGLIVAPTS